jgi:nucleoside-diphosphate-sugar epimerase/putative sterol carrier protein
MRVAVTGGSGQLGSLVLRRLANERSIQRIVAIDLRPPIVASSKIEDVRADVRDPSLRARLEGCDALVHLAFWVAKRGNRALQDSVNVGGSENVFRSALATGIRRILYASSVAQYGVVSTLPTPVVEETARTRQPEFWYAAAKHDVETLLDELSLAHPDLKLARFRPAILLGRRMEHLLGKLLRRGLLPDVENLPVVWDEDVADAFVLALRSGATGAFNLVADDPLPARVLARGCGLSTVKGNTLRAARAAEKLLTALRVLKPADPGWSLPVEAKLVYSSEKARRELGWKPKCPTSRAVLERFVQTVPRKLDRRIGVFATVVNRSPGRSELRGMEAAIHLELSGPNGGDLTLRARNERVRIGLGIPRPPDATVKMRADTLLDLLAGKTDLAGAQLEGEVHLEGNGHAGLLLGGVVESFRAAGRQGGFRGASARLLARWIAP